MSAAEIIELMLDAPVPAKSKKFLRIGYGTGIKHQLKPLPEPDKDKLGEMFRIIAALKNDPQKFRALMKQTIKELPHGRGGTPRKVKPEEEKTVCLEIQALRREYDNREAIRLVARKRGASERTIYRIWGKYHPKKKKSLQPNSTDRH